ncbi:hypothetical protein MF672_028375 [Actinomadura sp. ATCC 31491]|uniref:WD40 repeat domain-containing protein n=1 Tax=Actinomadura luzonensis TaxID=2805427 RepID=A0ABT0G0E5_9ACTN|nr:hypothetical protein [Actinomadura luzonensis]MCK2217680.1 hypothetical protein [Actinomadura luzonensis]
MRLRVLAVLAVLVGTFLAVPPQAASAATTYRGEGDDVIRIPVTTQPSLVKATHRGESNFIVWALSTSGKQVGLVANAVGDYKGTVAFNTISRQKVRSLEITADGAWTLQVLPLTKARYWAINAKGEGADVLRLTAPLKAARRITLRHAGESNFVVWTLDNRGSTTKLLVNKIGDYRGRVLLPAGTRYVTVEADGAWSINRG